MKLDLELTLSDEPPFPPPKLDNDHYLEFIEFTIKTARENGTLEKLLSSRARPVEEIFSIRET